MYLLGCLLPFRALKEAYEKIIATIKNTVQYSIKNNWTHNSIKNHNEKHFKNIFLKKPWIQSMEHS